MPSEPSPFASHLISPLHALLSDLASNPYPVLDSPPDLPRRASVALIIRVQPHYRYPQPENRVVSSQNRTFEEQLADFFAEEWVQHGDPEILYIKRAANIRDKWTGHVAFPGGRRDKTDKDDQEAAIREAWEEVGIDLSPGGVAGALGCGGLPQEVITASWGKVPLLTLCPYVFLCTNAENGGGTLKLQPGEVASAHWVPMRALMDDGARRFWTQNISPRTANGRFGSDAVSSKIAAKVQRWLTGDMLFAAIRLRPSESKFTTGSREFIASSDIVSRSSDNITIPFLFARGRLPAVEDTGTTLLLWGLTLGITGDFLDMLPPHDSVYTWIYPTFTMLDIRFVLWIMTWGFRRRKEREQSIKRAIADAELQEARSDDTWVMINGEKRYSGRIRADKRGHRTKAQVALLPAYYLLGRNAVFATLAIRVVVTAAVGAGIWKILRR
jgi:8-oxo-dGTP pyrophosphatase MutT (NUDIX family)